MYTRNQKQKGLKTRSHWDKKNRFGQIRGKEATRDKGTLEESSPLLPCLLSTKYWMLWEERDTTTYSFFPWASIVCLGRSTALEATQSPLRRGTLPRWRCQRMDWCQSPGAARPYLHDLRPWSRVGGLDTVIQWVPSEGSFTTGLELLPKFHQTHVKLQHKAM